jgi:hypothetical protein
MYFKIKNLSMLPFVRRLLQIIYCIGVWLDITLPLIWSDKHSRSRPTYGLEERQPNPGYSQTHTTELNQPMD